MESMILSENNEITDVEKKLFENIRKTAFATMMGASGMLPTEFKIPKPKK